MHNGTHSTAIIDAVQDWFSWSLHLVLGLVAGAVLDFLIGGRMMWYSLVAEEQFFHVVISVSLLGGSITLYFGDRLWFIPSVFAPDNPPQSPTSRACSVVICSLGFGTLCLAVYRHLQTAVWRRDRHSMSSQDLSSLLVLALLVGSLVLALRTGSIGLDGIRCRDKAPLGFWLYAALISLSITSTIIHLFR